MLRIKIIGYLKNADFEMNGSKINGSRIFYVSELSDYQRNAGAVGMNAGNQFLSAQRFNYPNIEINSYYDLDVVKKTAVNLIKVEKS